MNEQSALLEEETGGILVQIARHSLNHYVGQQHPYEPDVADVLPALQKVGASFITLTAGGRLRGCMGSTEARRSLAQDVAHNAVAAASRDPRFPPVSLSELSEIRLEVTVLTPLRPLAYTGFDDLVRKLHPGLDGVLLARGSQRGLLLPQVWGRIPQPARFLEALTYKAGIPFTELSEHPLSFTIKTFQVQHFCEPGYREPGN